VVLLFIIFLLLFVMQENDTRPDGRELADFRPTILNIGKRLVRNWPHVLRIKVVLHKDSYSRIKYKYRAVSNCSFSYFK